jgi:hypothetical protein
MKVSIKVNGAAYERDVEPERFSRISCASRAA